MKTRISSLGELNAAVFDTRTEHESLARLDEADRAALAALLRTVLLTLGDHA